MNQSVQVRQETKIPFREGIRPDLIGRIGSSGIYSVIQNYWIHLTNPPDNIPTTFGRPWPELRERQRKGQTIRDYHLPLAVVDRDYVKCVHEGRKVMDDFYPDLKRNIGEYIAQIESESAHTRN